MRIIVHQISFKDGMFYVYVAGEGFADFERPFKTRTEAQDWLKSLTNLLNVEEKANQNDDY